MSNLLKNIEPQDGEIEVGAAQVNLPSGTLSVTWALGQGMRQYQEDRIAIAQIAGRGVLFGVMDGHGGDQVSDWVSESLEDVALACADAESEPEAFLRRVFSDLHEGTRRDYCGSGVTLAWIPEQGDKVWIAVLGDCPAARLSSTGDLWVAPEHNVRTNEAECERAKERGGLIIRGYLQLSPFGMGLQMARALGDRELDAVLDREPEIEEISFGKGDTLVVSSDGVFDPMHVVDPEEFSRVVHLAKETGSAEALVRDAALRRTGDNASAIVITKS